MNAETDKKWRKFMKKWQVILGRAVTRGATAEEIQSLCEALTIVKRYDLASGVVGDLYKKEEA